MSLINVDQKRFRKQPDRIPEGNATALELLPFIGAILFVALLALNETGWCLIGCIAVILVLLVWMAYRDRVAAVVRYLLYH